MTRATNLALRSGIAGLVGILGSHIVAFSADPTSSPTASAAAAESTAGAVVSQASDVITLFVVLLVAGVAAIALTYLLTLKLSSAYYRAVEALAKLKYRTVPKDESPFQGEKAAGAEPAEALTIDGPDSVTEGKKQRYSIASSNTDPAPKWSVSAGVAAVNSVTGKPLEVDVTATGAGIVTLSVTQDTKTGTKQIAVLAADQADVVQLPFLGSGWASVAITILLLLVAAGLGLTGVLQGDAIATLLGGLLGYLFGVRPAAAATTASSSGSSKTGDTA